VRFTARLKPCPDTCFVSRELRERKSIHLCSERKKQNALYAKDGAPGTQPHCRGLKTKKLSPLIAHYRRSVSLQRLWLQNFNPLQKFRNVAQRVVEARIKVTRVSTLVPLVEQSVQSLHLVLGAQA